MAWILALWLALAASPAPAGVAALAERGRWTEAEVAALVAREIGDPDRFAADPAFRRRSLDAVTRLWPAGGPAALRADLLAALARLPGVGYDALESIEVAWRAAPRTSASRRAPRPPAGLRSGGDTEGAIAASFYSLPSSFVDAGTAASFLAAVRALDPKRTLVALTDPVSYPRLASEAARLRVALLESHGRSYTPWTRDPLSFLWTAKGGLFVLTRPNLQAGRDDDYFLGRELVKGLPAELDRAWGGVRWAEAPLPFHNGQVLSTGKKSWISLHSLEPRILALLGTDRVPVESFGTAAGIERYVDAARRAAGELAPLYGRPVRFVHPLPDEGAEPLAARVALLAKIGGGAGYDLDSWLTLLPGPGEGWALVADPAAGRALLAKLAPAELDPLRRGYGLAPEGAVLARELERAFDSPRALALAGFLDLAARHLESQGFQVARLPLLIVPVALLADREGVGNEDFWLTWNNAVVETRDGKARAEGFSSWIEAGDRAARGVFARAGCRLDLLPPLAKSVILTGGYRCASNHVRARR